MAQEPNPKKFYEWTVKIRVNAVWVADGFNLTEERLHNILAHHLNYAYGHEFGGEIIKAPKPDDIAREQGYKSAKDSKYTP